MMSQDTFSMQLHRSNFNQCEIEKYGTGAGIIPVSVSPDGEYYLFLGRERFLPQWRGSCRWSGFEGSRKANETLRTAALREFTEESLGVVFPNSEDLAALIDDKEYWLRVVLRITNDKRSERYHTSYVLPIPWNPNLPERFLEMRTNIERIDRLSREMERAFPIFALMSGHSVELGDVTPLPDSSIQLERYVSDEIENNTGSGTKEGFLRRCSEVQSEEEQTEERGACDSLQWRKKGEEGVEVLQLSKSDSYASLVLKWDSIRKQLEKEEITSHACVIARRGSFFNRIQEVQVHRDHLEKDEVRWWSATDLRRVLDGRGFLGNECFRPYFLPVLQTILHELSSSSPTF